MMMFPSQSFALFLNKNLTQEFSIKLFFCIAVSLLILCNSSTARAEWEWSANATVQPFSRSGTAATKDAAVAEMQSACNACPYFTDEQLNHVTGGRLHYRYLPEGGPDPDYTEWEYSFSLYGYGPPPNNLTADSLTGVVDWIRNRQPEQLDQRCSPTRIEVNNSWTSPFQNQFPTQEILCSATSNIGSSMLRCDSPGVTVVLEYFDDITQACKEREVKYIPARRKDYSCEEGFGRGVKNENGVSQPVCIPGQAGFVKGPAPSSACEGGAETTSNPCSPLTGEKLKSSVDFNANGLTFSRHYSSLYSINEPVVGNSWRHSYHDRLIFSNTGILLGWVSNSNQYVAIRNWPINPRKPASNNNRNLAEIEVIDNKYLARMTNGDTRVYDSQGRLMEIQPKSGGATSLSYVQGKLVRIENEFGVGLDFAYDGNKISQLTQPDGAVIQYQYDDLGNLEKVLYPDLSDNDDSNNPALIYHYEDSRFPSHLTGISDENGVRTQSYTYDESGKAITSEKARTSNLVGQEKVELDYQGGQ